MTGGRILFVNGGTNMYGFETRIVTIMRGLLDRGYAVESTVSGWNNGDFPRALRENGIPYRTLYLGWFYLTRPSWTVASLRNAPAALAGFGQMLRRFRPDLVFHGSYRSLAQVGWMVGPRNVVLVPDRWSRPWEWRLVHLLRRKVLAFIAPSDFIRDHLVRHGVPAGQAHAIHNPIPFGGEVRRPAGTEPRSVPTVGLVGQVVERKGHHVAIDALARVRERHRDLPFRLKVFGSGPDGYVATLKQRAESRGLGPVVEWCGYKTNKDDIYPQFDVGLVPTVDPEPFGLVAVEPAAYGKPVIASATGGLPEIVKHNETGWLVPPGDVEALAAQLAACLRDPGMVRRAGERAFADYRRRFDVPVILDQYCGVIDSLIARRRATEGSFAV